MRGLRPFAPTSNTHVHFQESLSPYPCKYCTQNCITNAYHWHYDCPFKNQNPTPLATSTTTDRQITPESRSEQNSSDDANNSYWQLLVPGHFNQNGSKLKTDSQYAVKNASSGEIIPCLLDTGSTLSPRVRIAATWRHCRRMAQKSCRKIFIQETKNVWRKSGKKKEKQTLTLFCRTSFVTAELVLKDYQKSSIIDPSTLTEKLA